MTAVQLPLADPPISGFVHHAYPLAIMLNDPASLPWLYSNYIQLYFDPKEPVSALSFNFYHYNWPYNGQYISPFLYNIWFNKQLILQHGGLEAFIRNAIDRGFHAYLICDEHYIPHRYSHVHGTHLAHDVLISGYDPIRRTYDLAGYDEHGTYRHTEATFEQLELAFRPSEHLFKPHHDNVQLFSNNWPEGWRFRIEPVIELLRDYAEGRDTSLRLGMRTHDRPVAFGIRVYGMFRMYAELIRSGKAGVDIRPFHLLWEHKKLMQSRIRFLLDEGHIPADSAAAQSFDKVERLMFRIRGNVIKAAAAQDHSYMKEAADELAVLADMEHAALSLLLEDLEGKGRRAPGAGDESEEAIEFQF